MNFDNFTIKAQQAVQQAVDRAQQNGQQAITPVHLCSLRAGRKRYQICVWQIGR